MKYKFRILIFSIFFFLQGIIPKEAKAEQTLTTCVLFVDPSQIPGILAAIALYAGWTNAYIKDDSIPNYGYNGYGEICNTFTDTNPNGNGGNGGNGGPGCDNIHPVLPVRCQDL